MFSKFAGAAAALLAVAPFVSAQTYTDCDPTNGTCPVDVGLENSTFITDFTTGENSSWVAADYTFITYGDQGAEFIIDDKNDAPTIHTDFYIFFGYVEVKMKAANGTGIISSIVLESDDLDEIDWEWLGGNNTSVETNYFGKGNTTAYDRAIYYDVDTPVDTFHTYALNWTEESLTWLIDGEAVRTLNYEDALNGQNYPQTPCRLYLGVWAGGASSSEGTVEWAGGATDFDEAPFIMYVESVKIVNYNPAMNYNWTDTSGSYESIQLINHTVSDNNSYVATTTATATASTGTGSSGSSSGSSSSSSGFSQSGSSAAGMGMDKAWIASSIVSLVGFAVGFALL